MDSHASPNRYAVQVKFADQATPREGTEFWSHLQQAARQVQGQVVEGQDCGPSAIESSIIDAFAYVNLPNSEAAAQLHQLLNQKTQGQIYVSRARTADEHIGLTEQVVGSTR
jgi:hypothetical protein